MSYASRLAAMSVGHAPKTTPRVIRTETDAPHEAHVETELRAPAGAATQPLEASREPDVAPDRGESREVESTARRDLAAQHSGTPPAKEPAERRVIERHETVATQPGPRSASPAAAPRPAREQVAMPASAQWLEEDRSAADPLVATAETDALRELMQRVRQWTSSAPVVIEPAAPTAPALTAAAVTPVAAAPAPSHVSIGNVVITVEDAPAPEARGARAPSPARSTSDRMARHHIRGD